MHLMVANAAAVIVARQNQYIRAFRRAGVLSSDRACGLGELGIREGWAFRRMVRRGVFVEASPGRYYMLEEAAERFVRERRKRALTFLAVFLLVFLVYALLSTAIRGHL